MKYATWKKKFRNPQRINTYQIYHNCLPHQMLPLILNRQMYIDHLDKSQFNVRRMSNDFLSYSQKDHFEPRFDPFLPHIWRTMILPDMRFSLKEAHYWPLLSCRKSQKTNEDFSTYSRKTPFWPPSDPRLTLYLENQIFAGHAVFAKRCALLTFINM